MTWLRRTDGWRSTAARDRQECLSRAGSGERPVQKPPAGVDDGPEDPEPPPAGRVDARRSSRGTSRARSTRRRPPGAARPRGPAGGRSPSCDRELRRPGVVGVLRLARVTARHLGRATGANATEGTEADAEDAVVGRSPSRAARPLQRTGTHEGVSLFARSKRAGRFGATDTRGRVSNAWSNGVGRPIDRPARAGATRPARTCLARRPSTQPHPQPLDQAGHLGVGVGPAGPGRSAAA